MKKALKIVLTIAIAVLAFFFLRAVIITIF